MTSHCLPLLYVCVCAYAEANLSQISFGGPLKLKILQLPLLLLKEEPFELLQTQMLMHDDV